MALVEAEIIDFKIRRSGCCCIVSPLGHLHVLGPNIAVRNRMKAYLQSDNSRRVRLMKEFLIADAKLY